jgi:hypothetical protein
MTRSIKRLPTESKEERLARHEFRRRRAAERAKEEKAKTKLEELDEDISSLREIRKG